MQCHLKTTLLMKAQFGTSPCTFQIELQPLNDGRAEGLSNFAGSFQSGGRGALGPWGARGDRRAFDSNSIDPTVTSVGLFLEAFAPMTRYGQDGRWSHHPRMAWYVCRRGTFKNLRCNGGIWRVHITYFFHLLE